MKSIVATLVGIVGLVGCAYSPSGADPFRVYISPEFTPGEVADVRSAMGAWENALDGRVMFVETSTCERVPGATCVYPVTEYSESWGGYTQHYAGKQYTDVYLNRVQEERISTPRHELGHVIGLEHIPHGIMRGDKNETHNIEATDVAEWCARFNCEK